MKFQELPQQNKFDLKMIKKERVFITERKEKRREDNISINLLKKANNYMF